ncbi:MAG: hypothetical protein J6A28_04715 [Clostridia bacterium]|nr:hypothetical protein [Clostridia bacterium]
MEEIREQPTVESQIDVAERGSQEAGFGKFKTVQALMDAYENLQSEFTKKCQLLSQYQKDKIAAAEENQNNVEEETDEVSQGVENGFNQEAFAQFLEDNSEAEEYRKEIEERFAATTPQQKSPYEIAWANVLLSHLKEGDKISDPIINQYVLSDENVKSKIIQNYLSQVNKTKPPITISSRSGDRVASVLPERPKTLADAKKIVDKMFS